MMIWRTADGKQIPLDQMDNSHLKNAIAYTERRARKIHRDSLIEMGMISDTPGLLDIDRPEAERKLLVAINYAEIFPYYDELIKERKRRYKDYVDGVVRMTEATGEAGGFGTTKRRVRTK